MIKHIMPGIKLLLHCIIPLQTGSLDIILGYDVTWQQNGACIDVLR